LKILLLLVLQAGTGAGFPAIAFLAFLEFILLLCFFVVYLTI